MISSPLQQLMEFIVNIGESITIAKITIETQEEANVNMTCLEKQNKNNMIWNDLRFENPSVSNKDDSQTITVNLKDRNLSV